MSEHEPPHPPLTMGRVELPEVVTVHEQAKHAGRQEIRTGRDDIDELRMHCTAFMDREGGAGTDLSMARTKMDEMIFWLRRHRERSIHAQS